MHCARLRWYTKFGPYDFYHSSDTLVVTTRRIVEDVIQLIAAALLELVSMYIRAAVGARTNSFVSMRASVKHIKLYEEKPFFGGM